MAKCAICKRSMKLVAERRVEIDFCNKCHVTWLDPGELHAIADARRVTIEDALMTREHRDDLCCPRCKTHDFFDLKIREYTFARCNDCGGVHLDNRTLNQLRAKSTRTPARESTGKKEEQQSITPHLGYMGADAAIEFLIRLVTTAF